jgi:hypothetical protein
MSEKGRACTPPPPITLMKTQLGWNVRQKVTIAILSTCCSVVHLELSQWDGRPGCRPSPSSLGIWRPRP